MFEICVPFVLLHQCLGNLDTNYNFELDCVVMEFLFGELSITLILINLLIYTISFFLFRCLSC